MNNPRDHRNFTKFWKGIPEIYRSGWTARESKRLKHAAFSSKHIFLAFNFIVERHLRMLVNLNHRCEMIFGSDSFNARQIAKGIQDDPEFTSLFDLIEFIRQDMNHHESLYSADLQLRRSYLTYTPCPRRRENPQIFGSKWLLFLNDDYHGGEVFFPSRRLVVEPKAGAILRWPIGIPFGRMPTEDGYSFTLEGENTQDQSREETWTNFWEESDAGPQIVIAD